MPSTTVTNNPSVSNDSPQQPSWKEKWLGHSVCTLDKITWLLGTTLLITGVVLFILNSLYATNFFIAATVTTSTGGGVLLLGLLTHCCLRCFEAMSSENIGKKKASSPSTSTKTFDNPVKIEISTEDFFASKGIFGLPKGLIDEIGIWRAYRTTNKKDFKLALDAGFILYGPPGTGKTTIAQHMAELLGGEHFEKKCGDLKSKYYGESEDNISELFNVPQEKFRIIVIDEISGLLSKRNGHWSDEVTEHFLGAVNGTAENKNYIVIGTTNQFEQLEPALVRRGRLGKKFKIDLPTQSTREAIFNYHLNKIDLAEGETWEGVAKTLASKTNVYSCADIVGVVNDAQKKALLANRKVTQQDFWDQLKE